MGEDLAAAGCFGAVLSGAWAPADNTKTPPATIAAGSIRFAKIRVLFMAFLS